MDGTCKFNSQRIPQTADLEAASILLLLVVIVIVSHLSLQEARNNPATAVEGLQQTVLCGLFVASGAWGLNSLSPPETIVMVVLVNWRWCTGWGDI